MDFTLEKYKELLAALLKEGYSFVPFCEYLNTDGKVVCMRHDVDLKPGNSLKIAQIEAEMGVRSSFYFRAVPQSWDEGIIRQIAELGHEVGYHYESLTTCKGNVALAYEDFCKNLEKLRAIVDVKTICMHGSPRSKFDSRDIWEQYDYKKLGIVAEPYLDIDWEKNFYLTDTGRCWNGYRFSVRDKIPYWNGYWMDKGLVYHRTDDILYEVGKLPDRIMVTTHPQRWNDRFLPWAKELIVQNVKNIVKARLVYAR